MKNKIVIVTGANAGIGKATAHKLAEMGAHVVMVCRNRKRGEKSLKEIHEKTNNKNLDLILCDFTSLNSINNFVKEFKNKFERLDVLINNHGLVSLIKSKTEDKIETRP